MMMVVVFVMLIFWKQGGSGGGRPGSTQNSYIMKLISIRSRKSALHLAAQLNTAVLQVFDLASMDCMIRPRLV